MKSISNVEFQQQGVRIKATIQFQVESTIMNENSKYFILAYKSLILSKRVLSQIRMFGKTKQSQKLLYEGILISSIDSKLSSFLQLIYN